MPNIYNYIDYRKFLLEFIAEKKLLHPRFSCRRLAVRLGMSAATFVRIVNGKRNVTEKMLPRFIDYLKLRDRASEYFSLMVELAQVKGAERKNDAYRKLLEFRSERIRTIRPRHYSLFEKWYLVALREIIDIKGTIVSAKGLAKALRPSITVREAEKAVDALRETGMIFEGKDGRFHASEKLLSTGEKWESIAVHHFQLEMARRAEEALLRLPKEERDFSTLTIGLSSAEFHRVREIIKKARQQILAIAEDSIDREYVYQLNTQLFPVSRHLKGGKKDAG
ncbi:MAG: TIGR02147 family protein [Chitinispirillaceae bacterium]|nr:TIGR02147 family protein [Chitinispirillaceae bacterium]